jgi:hypothetical protein
VSCLVTLKLNLSAIKSHCVFMYRCWVNYIRKPFLINLWILSSDELSHTCSAPTHRNNLHPLPVNIRNHDVYFIRAFSLFSTLRTPFNFLSLRLGLNCPKIMICPVALKILCIIDSWLPSHFFASCTNIPHLRISYSSMKGQASLEGMRIKLTVHPSAQMSDLRSILPPVRALCLSKWVKNPPTFSI